MDSGLIMQAGFYLKMTIFPNGNGEKGLALVEFAEAAKKLEPFCEAARMKGKVPSFGLAQDRLLRRLRSE
jgi:hypothetical protein